MRGWQEAEQPTPLLAHLPSSAVGRAPHAAARCWLRSCSQGSRGQQDPTPRKEGQAQRQDMDAPRPIQVLGRLAAKLTGGREAGLRALPPCPPSSLGARYPKLGWKILLGSWSSAPTEEGRGSHPSWRDPLVWRQERGQKTGQLLPRREPRGGGQEPRWGLPGERTKSSCSCRANSGRGLAFCKPPSVLNS